MYANTPCMRHSVCRVTIQLFLKSKHGKQCVWYILAIISVENFLRVTLIVLVHAGELADPNKNNIRGEGIGNSTGEKTFRVHTVEGEWMGKWGRMLAYTPFMCHSVTVLSKFF